MSRLFLFIPDPSLCEAVIEQITGAGFAAPRLCTTPHELLAQSEGQKDIIFLIDADAQKASEILSKVAMEGVSSTVLVLGSSDDDGVTETFAKPLRLGHLLTRLRYHLETAPLLRDRNLAVGPYWLEPQQRRLTGAGEAIRLTEKETALLVFLAQSTAPVTRRDLLAAVWGYDERIDTHTLETHIYQLRRKLDARTEGGESEKWLVNEAGAYRLMRGPE